VIVRPLMADRLTVKVVLTVPALPSVTAALPMLMVGAVSSLVIVPMPVAVVMVALVGAVKLTA